VFRSGDKNYPQIFHKDGKGKGLIGKGLEWIFSKFKGAARRLAEPYPQSGAEKFLGRKAPNGKSP